MKQLRKTLRLAQACGDDDAPLQKHLLHPSLLE
jgi:hypothetical protein